MKKIETYKLVEMIVFCPDWREKEAILERYIKMLVKQERLDQIREELDKLDEDE